MDEDALRASLMQHGLSKVQSRKIRNRLSALESRQRHHSQMQYLVEINKKLQKSLRFLMTHDGYRDIDTGEKRKIEELASSPLEIRTKSNRKRVKHDPFIPMSQRSRALVESIATRTPDQIFEPAEFQI